MKTQTKLQQLVFEGLSPSNPMMSDEEIKAWLESLPRVKDQLQAYVKAELDCMAKKERSISEKEADAIATGQGRLPVSISVDTLAYLFKLLVKVKVIRDTGKNTVLLFLAKSFQTPGIGDAEISPNSLDSKYRQVTKNTAITVRAMLSKMLKELDLEFKD